jgi:hypothetical protein
MKKIDISRTLSKMKFQLKKHSPEILVVAGVVGTVTSAVMACKATTKINDILENTEKELGYIHEAVENDDPEVYTVEDSKKDLVIVYAQTGVKLAKLYAPALILGGLSISSILASSNILRKRNVALAAAYATVDKGFKEYRGRVVERYGAGVDKELKYDVKTTTFEETTTDNKGKVKNVTNEVDIVNPNEWSDYARFYDDGCEAWCKDPELNLTFLKAQQRYANDLLIANGYLFLNDVYAMLGIPKTQAGQVVGWIYNPDKADESGDNFVDFGIYDAARTSTRDFVNGYERTILLDFNVDGYILNMM